jgi:hypothetical protein
VQHTFFQPRPGAGAGRTDWISKALPWAALGCVHPPVPPTRRSLHTFLAAVGKQFEAVVGHVIIVIIVIVVMLQASCPYFLTVV